MRIRANRRPDCEHTEGRRHDCDYVSFRDALIPLAEAAAFARHPEPSTGTKRAIVNAWSKKWDWAFHREMLRLTTDPFANVRTVRAAS